ncbi:hypothetical protein LOAG_18694 [Loa loa]|uniref:Uncharacterized protein n=1 Tax=Loa loa TaxID=7209 RepID=A0A1S0UEA1_LOALO|nr:hypothetical protein LOAG_18694 [Loa loa]EJD73919.1 hypothetical protein LOAG_18694 [Loa loa]
MSINSQNITSVVDRLPKIRWADLNWVGLSWVGLSCIELIWVALSGIELRCIESTPDCKPFIDRNDLADLQ